METDLSLKNRYLKNPIKILRAVGLWQKNKENPLYILYGFAVIFTSQYLYAIFQIIYMIDAWGDIEKIAEASFLLLTQLNLCNKIAMFSFRMKTARRLTEFMDSIYFRPGNEKQWKIVNASGKEQVIEFYIFLGVSYSTIATWAVFPWIDSSPGERVLPFQAWYPLPTSVSPFYEFLYIYQIGGVLLSASCNVSLDRLFTAMTATACAQIKLLKDNLINIKEYSKQDYETIMNRDENEREKQINRTEKIEELMAFRLIHCVKHHRYIVEFVAGVERVFTSGLLGQFAASVAIICVTGLQITLIDPASMKFFTKVTYMVTMLAQIFFLCRIGNEITFISTTITDAAYTLPWPDRHPRFKSTLLIFMERLKRPILTRAGNFFHLSLQTFVSILRSSYSYFAVLQQLNSE